MLAVQAFSCQLLCQAFHAATQIASLCVPHVATQYREAFKFKSRHSPALALGQHARDALAKCQSSISREPLPLCHLCHLYDMCHQ